MKIFGLTANWFKAPIIIVTANDYCEAVMLSEKEVNNICLPWAASVHLLWVMDLEPFKGSVPAIVGVYTPNSETSTRLLEEIKTLQQKEKSDNIAVSVIELSKYGCPYCGFRSGSTPIVFGGCASWVCGDCGRGCIILGEGITQSKIGAGSPANYPMLQSHPRKGIPSHGRPDEKPKGGGEFFSSRGIGSDVTPGCFACGGDERLYKNISAFVQCKEAGERVVGMFQTGARLDYREYEPDRVQVKIGACDTHRVNLEFLDKLTSDAGGTITTEMVENSKKLKV